MLSQVEIEGELQRLTDRLEIQTEKLAELAVRAAEAEVAYKFEYAKVFVGIEGAAMMLREQESMLATAPLRREWKVADALHDSQLEAIRTIRAQLDSLRSILSSVKAQV